MTQIYFGVKMFTLCEMFKFGVAVETNNILSFG